MKTLRILALSLAAAALSSCTVATVKNPDGSTTTTKTLDPNVSKALADGSVVVTGALADNLADRLRRQPRVVAAK